MSYKVGDRVIALRQNDVEATIVALRDGRALPYTIDYVESGHPFQRHVSAEHIRLAAGGAPAPAENEEQSAASPALPIALPVATHAAPSDDE
jgi:hypothetical protein